MSSSTQFYVGSVLQSISQSKVMPTQVSITHCLIKIDNYNYYGVGGGVRSLPSHLFTVYMQNIKFIAVINVK